MPPFPNARYLVARTEYEHWRDASDEARTAASAITFDDAVTPLFDFDVVDLVDVDHVVTASVALMPTPGHSPGHVSVRIRSEGAQAIITGDCVHSPVQLAEPDWFTIVDSDPDLSTATRRALIAECCDRDVLVIGTHFPPPVAGHGLAAIVVLGLVVVIWERRPDRRHGLAAFAVVAVLAVLLVVEARIGRRIAWDQLALAAVTVGTGIRGVILRDLAVKFLIVDGREVAWDDHRRLVWLHLVVLPVLVAGGAGFVVWWVRRQGVGHPPVDGADG